MKINDAGEKEMERPSITEREISKIKELSAAPLESADSEFEKEKLSEARDVVSERLAQQKEARPMDTPAGEPKEHGFEHDFAELSDDLSEGSKGPGFKPVDDKPGDAFDAQKQLEQRRLSDQKDLEGIATGAESPDEEKDTDADDTAKPRDVSFKGSSCGGGHGCSGSTWCYGSGDFR